MLHENEQSIDGAELAAFAEDAGFDFAGFADSQSIFRECYSSLAIAAARTSRLMLGPTVTNPVSRHPVVTASAIATIHEISGGRAFLGIGTGDSALYNLGLKPSRIADFGEAVGQIRRAFDDQVEIAATRSVDLKWNKERVPIMVAGSGPKAMDVAARLGDGAIIDVGSDPEIVGEWIGYMRDIRSRSDLADMPFSVWIYTKAFVADSLEEARKPIAQIIAAAGNDAFRYNLERKRVPSDLVEPLQEFHRRYAFSVHASVSSRTNVDLMDELGLTDFLYSRFSIAGTKEMVAGRLSELNAVGADGVLFSGVVPAKRILMSRLAEAVELYRKPLTVTDDPSQ
jgi:5,10-methylenetetrahydromethanopterin reductase